MIKTNMNFFVKILSILGLIFLILFPFYLLMFLLRFIYKIVFIDLFFFLLPILLLLFYFLYLIIFILETKIVLFFLKKNKINGIYKVNDLNKTLIYYVVSSTFTTILYKLLKLLLINSSIPNEILLRVYGNVGKNSMIGSFILSPYLIKIGDNCVIGKNSLISAHFINGNKIIIKKINIGNNVTIGANVVISPGVKIEDNVLVKINSFVKPNSVLKKNSVYSGNPAKFERKI